MSRAFYPKSSLAYRKSRLTPNRFDPDDLLSRTPMELEEMLTWRLQQLWIGPERHGVPSRIRMVEDLSLQGFARQAERGWVGSEMARIQVRTLDSHPLGQLAQEGR